MRNSDLVKAINEKNKGMFDYINRHSGLNITSLGKEFIYWHDILQSEVILQSEADTKTYRYVHQLLT